MSDQEKPVFEGSSTSFSDQNGLSGKKSSKDKGSNTSAAKMLLFGLLAALVIGGIIFYSAVKAGVKQGSDSAFVVGAAGVLRVPIAQVNGHKILYSDYVEDLKALHVFYNSAGSDLTVPSDEELSDQVLSRLITNIIVSDVAKDFDVNVTDEELEEERQAIIENIGGEEDAEKEIMDKYGWTFDKFIEKVVVPLRTEEKLKESFNQAEVDENDEFGVEQVKARHILFMVNEEISDETAKKNAEEVLQRIKDGEDFAALAGEFGSDGTKDNGGDLGWFSRGMMVPEFEEAVFNLEPGQLGDELVKTEFGYHIVKVDDKRIVRDFETYMTDKLKNSTIKLFADIHNPFDELLQQLKDLDNQE